MAAGEGSRLRRGGVCARAFGRRQVPAGFQRFHQALAQPGIGEALGHGADAVQRFAAFGRVGGDLGQGFVLQDPAAGNIAGLGFAFAPGRQCRQHGRKRLLLVRGLSRFQANSGSRR